MTPPVINKYMLCNRLSVISKIRSSSRVVVTATTFITNTTNQNHLPPEFSSTAGATRSTFNLPPPDWSLKQSPFLRKEPMSDVEIEEIHHQALYRKSTTYTDPSTGFLVFTELAHLQRGNCCGNLCRHCPYGWENARTGQRREAIVKSGDAPKIRARLEELDDMAAQAVVKALSPAGGTIGTKNEKQDDKKEAKTGGRHGGRLTKKNVPYTRGGDKGTSQLLTGERRSKADDAFEAMGTVDELCSFVGVVHAQLLQDARVVDETITSDSLDSRIDIRDQLLEIMSRLFDIGSHVAKPAKLRHHDDSSDSESDSDEKESRFVADGIGGGFDPQHVQELEDWIDQLTEDLPELNSFLLPTGSLAAAHFHVARTVCRRTERRIVPLVQAGVCDPTALQYINRLSDYFFSASRWVNLVEAEEAEIQYRRPQKGAKQRTRVEQRR